MRLRSTVVQDISNLLDGLVTQGPHLVRRPAELVGNSFVRFLLDVPQDKGIAAQFAEPACGVEDLH